MKPRKILKFLKKNKIARGVANILVGAVNGTPLAAVTPSIQHFNESIENADLDGDGKIGSVKRGELLAYYLLGYLGLILVFCFIIFGLSKNYDLETIEWGVDMIIKAMP